MRCKQVEYKLRPQATLAALLVYISQDIMDKLLAYDGCVCIFIDKFERFLLRYIGPLNILHDFLVSKFIFLEKHLKQCDSSTTNGAAPI